MKLTRNFKFPYLELGDVLYESDEKYRWINLDRFLSQVGTIGIQSGLNISYNQTERKIYLSPGSIWIDKVYFKINSATAIGPLELGRTYKVYSRINLSWVSASDGSGYSYPSQRPVFEVTENQVPGGSVVLGVVSISGSNEATISYDLKEEASFAPEALRNAWYYFKGHTHFGSPQKISLVEHVQGTINLENLPSIPANRISGSVFFRDDKIPRDVSHVGRVDEKPFFEKIVCFTKDFKHYLTEPWGVDDEIYVFLNGQEINTGFTKQNSFNVGQFSYGAIIFDQRRSATDRVEIVKRANIVRLPGGPWDPSCRVIVKVNGIKLDPNEYKADPQQGTITFNRNLKVSDECLVTIRDVYIADTGNNLHSELDEKFGSATSFAGWYQSLNTELALGNIGILSSGEGVTKNTRFIDFSKDSRRKDDTFIDKEVSTIKYDESRGRWDIDYPMVEDPDTEIGKPVEPIQINPNTVFSQSFKADYALISTIVLFGKYEGSGNGHNVNYELTIYSTDAQGSQFTTLTTITGHSLNISRSGGPVVLKLKNPVGLVRGNYYAFSMKIIPSSQADYESFYFYTSSVDYLHGSGFIGGIGDQYRLNRDPVTGSDDFWFLVYGTNLNRVINSGGFLSSVEIGWDILFGQTFKTPPALSGTFYTISKLALMASINKTGGEYLNCNLTLYQTDQNASNFTPWKVFQFNNVFFPEFAGQVVLNFETPVVMNPDAYYAFSIEFPENLNQTSGIPEIYRLHDNYVYGYGFFGGLGQEFRLQPHLNTGSDDFWFELYGQYAEFTGTTGPPSSNQIDVALGSLIAQSFKATINSLQSITLHGNITGYVAAYLTCELTLYSTDELNTYFNVIEKIEIRNVEVLTYPKPIFLNLGRKINLNLGSHYAFSVKFLENINYIGDYLQISRSSSNYVDGHGYVNTLNSSGRLQPLNGSDDFWFELRGQYSRSIEPTGPPSSNKVDIQFDQLAGQSFKATINSMQSIVMHGNTTANQPAYLNCQLTLYHTNSANTYFNPIETINLRNVRVSNSEAPIVFNLGKNINLTLDNYYAFSVKFLQEPNYSGTYFQISRASINYVDGYGYVNTLNSSGRLQPLNGSDDFWFSIYQSPTSSDSFYYNSSPQLNLVINPAICLVMDNSGSTRTTDPEGKRMDAAKQFISSFLNTYNSGVTDPAKKAGFSVTLFGITDPPGMPYQGWTDEELNIFHQIENSSTHVEYGIYIYRPELSSNAQDFEFMFNALKNKNFWLADTPLEKSIEITANYLRQSFPNRRKFIVVFTDGMDTVTYGSRRDEVAKILLGSGGEDVITLVACCFGTSDMTEWDLYQQAQLMGYLATSTGGYYYNDDMSSNISSIVENMIQGDIWGYDVVEDIYELPRLVYINMVRFDVSSPGSSEVYVDVYTRESPSQLWDLLVKDQLVQPNMFLTVNRLVKQFLFRFDMKFGSFPKIDGFGIFAHEVMRGVMYSVPLSSGDLPMLEMVTTGHKYCLEGIDVIKKDMYVDVHCVPLYFIMQPVKDYGRNVFPAIVADKATPLGDGVFEVKDKKWYGDPTVLVSVNGRILDRHQFIDFGAQGRIKFKVNIPEDSDVRVTVKYKPQFRLAWDIVFTSPYADFDAKYLLMWSRNKRVG